MTGKSEKLTRFFGAQDMTEGRPLSKLVQFSIPLLIGNFAQQMYNTVDSIVVGHYVGDTALASVGASGPIINLLLVLFIGISVGAGIMVSQYFGAKQKEALSNTVGTVLTLSVLTALFIMVAGTLLARPMMAFLHTPEEILDMACSYLQILFLGIAGCAFYNILSGILRGLGDSLVPLLFMLLACGLNIVLDLLFVAVFQWSVAGVALATVLAQGISAICCFVRLYHMRDVLTIDRHTLKLRKKLVIQLAKLGLPSGLSQAIFSMAALAVQSLTNTFGTAVITCSIVVMRVDGFAMMPNFTFGTAMTTFTGQNMGAGKIDRVDEGTKDGLRAGLMVSVVLVLILLLFGGTLMRMFTDTQEIIDLGVRMLRVLAVGYIAMAVTQTLSGVMRGAGDTLTPMWISLAATVGIRVPIAYGLAYLTRSAEFPVGRPESLYISLMISWVIGAVLTAIFYKRGKWRKKRLVHKRPALSEDE